MKKFAAILFLTAAAASAQPRRIDPARVVEVKYDLLAALDCSDVQGGFLAELASGCFFPRVRITAASNDPTTVGFFVVVAYYDSATGDDGITPIGNGTATVAITSKDAASGNFVIVLILGTRVVLKVSALELLPGKLVYPQ